MRLRDVLLLLFMVVACATAGRKKKKTRKSLFRYEEPLEDCSEKKNEVVNFSDLKVNRLGKYKYGLAGVIEIKKELRGSIWVSAILEIKRHGKWEYFLSVREGNLCKRLAEENQVWSAFVNALNLEKKSCPLPLRNYTINNVQLDSKGMLIDSSFDAEYRAKIRLMVDMKKELLCLRVCGVVETVAMDDDQKL